MSPPSAEPPYLLIVAGPNGSGKSTVYRDAATDASGRTFWIINPDLLTVRIRDAEGLDQEAANLAAVTRIEAWLEASIAAHQTIGVETVLSTDKYRRLVEMARERGFEIHLIYVVLDGPERNIERVAARVRNGGHQVPRDKILSRHARSLVQMPWFLSHADRAWIYDNSSAEPQLIGEKIDGVVTLDSKAPDFIVRAVETIRTA